MTDTQIELLREEIEEYLPTRLQAKLDQLFGEAKAQAPRTRIRGMFLEEVRVNSWGNIRFSGFCEIRNGEGEEFLREQWMENRIGPLPKDLPRIG